VVVCFDGDTSWMGDGFHRSHGSANASHGLKRTPGDQRRAVSALLADKEWGVWSTVRMAQHCGVSEPLVRARRRSRPALLTRRDLTKHGTESTMDTSRLGRSSAHGLASEPEARWYEESPEFVPPGIPANDFRERWRRHDRNALGELWGAPGVVEPDPVQRNAHRASERWDKSFLDLSVLACSVQASRVALMASRPASRQQLALAPRHQWHACLEAWMQAIEEDLRHATHVDDIPSQEGAGPSAGAPVWQGRHWGNPDRGGASGHEVSGGCNPRSLRKSPDAMMKRSMRETLAPAADGAPSLWGRFVRAPALAARTRN
jgi:hypothetical protein